MNDFLSRLKRVKLSDIIQIWKLPVALICAMIYRVRHNNLWIVCENQNEARDNGYWFYQYVRTEHPEQECIYAISSKSPDIEKIKRLGEWVEFGSLKHWILYLASSKKISSQKAGNPNAAVFYFLEVYGLLKDRRVFLQHGIIKDDLKWLYYNVTRMDRFICGAYPEYKYVEETFGYPEGNVCYTGLCRFDGWHVKSQQKKHMIVIMPTWRKWIADEDDRLEKYEGTRVIPETEYFKTWVAFLRDPAIERIAAEHDIQFIFYPHRDMQKYIEFFPQSTRFLRTASAQNMDIQEILRDASMMITDYSSVFFDMLYMKKPVVFYQFDYNRFRKGQYEEGYFDYSNNPFAKSYRDRESVFKAVEQYISNDFAVSQSYLEAHKDYFRLYDTENCRRVYNVVNAL